MSQRPNILIISADQHRFDCLGVAGRRVKTPHLDALARRGTRFGSCITPSVACQPARASILTGQLCRTHGVHDNGIDLDPTIGEAGFAGTLAKAGYQSSFFGKAHFSTYKTRLPTGTPECIKSSARYAEDWNGPYMGFDHVELILPGTSGFAPKAPPQGQHYERFFNLGEGNREKIKLYRSNANATQIADHCWHSQLPVAHHHTPWTADRAIDWLRHSRNPEQAFCSWVSFHDLHHPFDCPEPWSRLHDPASVDLPELRKLNPESLPWWYRSALASDPSNGLSEYFPVKLNMRSGEQTDQQLREITANAYGQIAFIDAQIGRLMMTLDELGIADNTHVFYLSDHGDWLGNHGLVYRGPMFFESLLRVPMIWRGPDVPENRVVFEPVSTLDISPTLMELAQCQPQLAQHGETLSPLLDGKSKREYAMCEWELLPNRLKVPLSLRCVRTRTYKLTKDMNSGLGELYDLLADPNETNNLFDNGEAAEAKQRLETYLLQRPSDEQFSGIQVGAA
ncbi:MAG: sulfatase-like hydrolase/transferase [Granulosicoccus sp.]|nr:sulfatase-like hydrolase/transferase [Granulosicoccus sp.]